MANIIINDGLEKVTINGDENRAFYFNPTDFNLSKRLRDSLNSINKKIAELCSKEEELGDDYIELFDQLGNLVKEEIDNVFNAPVSKAVFGQVSPLAIIEGKMYFSYVFDALMPIIENRLEESRQAMERHTAKYVNKE